MDIHDFVGKQIEITIVRGLGRNKKIIVRKGRLTDIIGNTVCLQGSDGKHRWVCKPNLHNDTIKVIGSEKHD